MIYLCTNIHSYKQKNKFCIFPHSCSKNHKFIDILVLCFCFFFQDDLAGQVLLDVVFAKLNLIETAYFGLRYLDAENQTVRSIFSIFYCNYVKWPNRFCLLSFQHWLDVSTRLARQLKGSKDIYDMYFGVKFYAADPTKLVEEITR